MTKTSKTKVDPRNPWPFKQLPPATKVVAPKRLKRTPPKLPDAMI